MTNKQSTNKKSVAAAVLLGLFLGPFGTFYTGWKTFLLFIGLFFVGLFGIIAITGSAYEETMAEVQHTDELYIEAAEVGASIGAGLGFVILFLPYMAILGLSALITNVVSCQRQNNRVERYLRDEEERRHQELMGKKTE